MALTRIWGITKTTVDVSQAVFVDSTVYGTPELNRNQEAHYVLIAKMDENQVLSFISGIDNSTPLATTNYSFANSVDGAYRMLQFNPPFYSGAATYTKEVSFGGVVSVYADIVWHPGTAKFYKAIATSFTAIEPGVTLGWATSWQADPDFTLEVSNNKTNTFIKDDIITFRYEDCLVEYIDETTDDILCGLCTNWDKLFPTLSAQLLLDGANSNNWQNKQTRSEIIIKAATKQFCC
jgi:hypothetical protein